MYIGYKQRGGVGKKVVEINKEEVMERVWMHTMMRKVSWKECKGPAGSSVRLQLEDVGMKWPRYDVIVAPDSRNMNLKETCPDDLKKNDCHVVQRKVVESLGRET